jgi:hypothetical protein
MLPVMNPSERSLLFREVNDRIYDLVAPAEPDLHGEFLCECGRECGRRVMLLPAEFATLRRAGELVRSPDCRGLRFGLRDGRSRPADGVPVLS